MAKSSRRDEPEWIVFSGWQGSDEAHLAGAGVPAYRIVFKTLRAAIAEASLAWPNMRIITGHGDVRRGGVNLPGALPARQEGKWVLPEYGELVPDGDVLRYSPTGVEDFVFKPWEGEIKDVFYVEFLLHTNATEPPDQIIEGRERLAELKAMFDVRFGPRVLGVVLTEEAGEVFDDWHFNRRLGSDQIGHEFQLDVIGLSAEDILAWSETDMARYQSRPLEEKQRLRLASQWYWLAVHERDRVNQYLALWFVVEVLAMPDTTNVRPVRELLAAHVDGTTERDWQELVGRHFGRRSKLVHGQAARAVAAEDVASLRKLVEALLAIEFSSLSVERSEALRQLAGLS